VGALRDHPRLYGRQGVGGEGGSAADVDAAGKKVLAKLCRDFGAEYVMPLKPYERLLGAVLVGQRIDHKKFTAENERCIDEFFSEVSVTLWNILQMQYYMYEGLSKQ
jgi:hypothetical protein